MTLDPVHVDSIAQLARRIGRNVDDSEHRSLADLVWEEFLDPLLDRDDNVVVEPLGSLRKRCVDVEDAALQENEFPTRHGLDSGTINPTSFKNGLVLDVAQAAMSATPSDLEIHRGRTIVATVHANDPTVKIPEGWAKDDEGHCRWRVIRAPKVNRYAEGVVHALSLYLAESEHAHEYAEEVSDLLVLDGPIYPKEILTWEDRHPELANTLLEETHPREIVERYVRLVERFAGREVPLVGFVKNPSSKYLTRAIRKKELEAPWVDDAAFFAQVLERGERRHGEWERRTDQLTFTNWFVSKGGADGRFAANPYGIERDLSAEDYQVTFFVVYDPRDDVVYKVEAPYAFTKDADLRERLERQLLRDVAYGRGPPMAVEKADELARISVREKEALRRKIEEETGSDRAKTYDVVRWGEEF